MAEPAESLAVQRAKLTINIRALERRLQVLVSRDTPDSPMLAAAIEARLAEWKRQLDALR